MKPTSLLLGFAFILGGSVSSYAAATAEGAQRLTSVFQTYLGSEAGVVTVTPSGDSYATRIDFAPLFAKIKEPGLTVSLTPIEWTITEQGGGKWKVDQNQPLSLAVKAEGKLDMKASVGTVKGSGVFDEQLQAFASSETEFSQIAIEQDITEAAGTGKTNYTIASITAKSAMTGSADSADGTANYAYRDLRQTVSVPAAADGSSPAMEFSIATPAGVQDAVIKGLKPRALNALAAWFVAHPSKEAMILGQAELKDKLRAALPVFGSISATSTMDQVSVNTLVGKFAMAKLGIDVEANGVVKDGFFRESFTFSGFTTPEGIVPPFAQSLVPKDFKIDVNVKDFDLASPAAIILDNLDLSKDPPVPDTLEPELTRALMPKGAVTIGLGPSQLLAAIYDLKTEGSMTAGPTAMPAGQATISLKGIDDIMSALQAAPPEFGMSQVAPVIIVAKGMAKTEADGYLSWKIESTPTGSITVNGTDISKMGGQ